jgi:hypothetical protein
MGFIPSGLCPLHSSARRYNGKDQGYIAAEPSLSFLNAQKHCEDNYDGTLPIIKSREELYNIYKIQADTWGNYNLIVKRKNPFKNLYFIFYL